MGISSINRTSTGHCSVSSASSRISSSLNPPIRTVLILIFSNPACSAASIPFNASCSFPPLVIDVYFFGFSVSRLMLSRFTPASRKSDANAGSSMPFVVRHTSPIPCTAAMRRQMERMFFLTSGSPPVTRTFRIPSEAAASTARIISSSVSISSCRSLQTPSAGIQYRQRRLHRSVTDRRKYVISLLYRSRIFHLTFTRTNCFNIFRTCSSGNDKPCRAGRDPRLPDGSDLLL